MKDRRYVISIKPVKGKIKISPAMNIVFNLLGGLPVEHLTKEERRILKKEGLDLNKRKGKAK
jgi:hypothetical protein